MYLPVRVGPWKGHRLIPTSPDWLEENDSFNVARRRLARGGPRRSTRGLSSPITTNWATRTPTSSCATPSASRTPTRSAPATPTFASTARTLIDETLKLTECRGVVLEACGAMGVEHAGVHDKLEFANFTPRR